METLKYTKMLEKAGFTRKQSEAQVQVLSKSIGENLVTKQDLIHTEHKIDTKFSKVETHINAVEARLNHKFSLLNSNIKHEMEKLQNQLIVKLGFMMFSLFGGAVAVGGLFLAYLN